MAAAILLLGAPFSPLESAFMAVAGALWLYWVACAAYLLLLSAAALFARLRPVVASSTLNRFCILIPAHDEALNIAPVLDGMQTLDYPAERYSLVVIADNCTDDTAAIARDHGAEAMERTDPERRGKGFALDWALASLLKDPRRFDAFLIVDADSALSPNFLTEINAALLAGHPALQGYYGVLNEEESWRTRLMAVALALAHYVRPLGRRRLGLSDGLKGNGMCFAREVFERVPWSGESITEDIEYTLRLVEAGYRIHFVPGAVVRAQMPTTGSQAASQRERWEGGRYALMSRALSLLGKSLASGSVAAADRAIELLIPPFAELLALPVLVLALAAVIGAWSHGSSVALWLAWEWGAVLLACLTYLGLGLWIARVPFSVSSSLLRAPFYIVWKFALYGAMIARRGAGGWKRTERRSL